METELRLHEPVTLPAMMKKARLIEEKNKVSRKGEGNTFGKSSYFSKSFSTSRFQFSAPSNGASNKEGGPVEQGIYPAKPRVL